MTILELLPDGDAVRTIVFPSGNQAVRVLHTDDGFLRDPPPPKPHRGGAQFYVPYTRVHPKTVAGAPDSAIWVDVSSGPFAFYGAMYSWWERALERREGIATIEHDVVCRPDVVEAFETCPEPWCVFGYADICCQDETGWSPCMEAWRNELGCTRFRTELIEAVPDALTTAPLGNSGHPITWDWHNMCDGLGNHLRAAGFTHHWHFPWVEHHHMAL